MTLTNQDIAGQAREIAARSDGLRRRAALCVAVACRETGTLAAARKVLDGIELPDVSTAAAALLDELAGTTIPEADDDGQTHD